jgi:uncharacterized protein
MSKEIRQLVSRAEIRADETKFQLTGVAVAYNTLSAAGVPYSGWREQVAPGAFQGTLSQPDSDVKALWSHDSSKPLGRQRNGTLQLSDSPSGLRYTLQLDRQNQFHVDCFQSVKRSDVDALSFAFLCNDDDLDDTRKIRTVKAASLLEISFVVFPAYPEGTSAEARFATRIADMHGQKEAEKYLRGATQRLAAQYAKVLRDGFGSPLTDFASLIAQAHTLTELACEILKRANDDFDADNGYQPRSSGEPDPDLGYRFKKSRAHLSLACDHLTYFRLGFAAKARKEKE